MGIFIFLLVGGFIAPLLLSIVAFSRASRAIRELDELRANLRAQSAPPPAYTAPSAATEPALPVEPKQMGAPPTAPAPAPRLEPLQTPSPVPIMHPPPPSPKPDVELALGGRVASFLGAAAILIAVAFFVGYAIQQGLLGPLPRVILSGVTSAVLLLSGHVFHRKDARYAVLSQALTGAGAALLYFTVFAAHRLFHFIGVGPALAGLVVSAVGVLGLARRYDSQAVAILGVLGAYATPWLVEPLANAGLFPLVYVLFVNVPVLALYRVRPWHTLPNLAVFFAVLHVFVSFSPAELDRAWPAAICLVALFAGLAGLNVVSFNRVRSSDLRALDLIRLTFAAGAFGLQLARVFAEQGTSASAGVPLALVALLHAAAATRFARRAPSPPEAVAFAHYAALFVGAAIWMRFEGLPVYTLWGVIDILTVPLAK